MKRKYPCSKGQWVAYGGEPLGNGVVVAAVACCGCGCEEIVSTDNTGKQFGSRRDVLKFIEFEQAKSRVNEI